MKFTKEEACEKITAEFSKKVEKIDDWGRTIKENVETLFSLVGENSEMEIDDFVAKSLPLLETQLGHINKANKTVATNFETQIADLKKQIEAAKKTEKKSEQNSELEERLQKLEAELKSEKTAKMVEQKKSELVSAVEQKGVKNKAWTEAMVSKISVNEDTDVAAEAESLVEIYNKFVSKTPPNITPGAGGGGSISEHIKNVVKQAGEYNKNGI